MTVLELQEKKPVKQKEYDWTFLEEIFRGVEKNKGNRRNKKMKKNYTIKFKYYKVDVDGNYKEFDEALPDNFDYTKPFYLITDLDYANGTLEDDDLCRRIDHVAIDGPVQLMYCPSVKEDLDFIYTMAEDMWISGVYSSCVIKDGKYAGKKCGYHFFTDNKESHRFTQEELVEKICSGVEEEKFLKAVAENPEIQINEKGRVLRYKESSRAKKIMEDLD